MSKAGRDQNMKDDCDMIQCIDFRGHSQTTWTERHTYLGREMSTNVHVRYIHGQPFVHVGMNFTIFLFKDRKVVSKDFLT